MRTEANIAKLTTKHIAVHHPEVNHGLRGMINLAVGVKEQRWRSGNGDRIVERVGTEETDRDHPATNSGSHVNEAQHTNKTQKRTLL